MTLESLRARIDFRLVDVPTFDANAGLVKGLPELDRRLAEYTASFTRRAFELDPADLPTAASFDAALGSGEKDFCLIQNSGHLFVAGAGLAADLEQDLADCAFLTGHIMDRGGYFYLHDQCLLVNRRTWERVGKPTLGIPMAGRTKVAVPHRSLENVHDDYTPRALDPTGVEIFVQAVFGYGWNGISESLKADCRVLNWSDGVRTHKRHCYAYYGNPQEWLAALTDVTAAPPTSDTLLAAVLDLLRPTRP